MKSRMRKIKKIVLFHQMEIGASAFYDKELIVKYAPKRAISSLGKRYEIADNTAVELVAK